MSFEKHPFIFSFWRTTVQPNKYSPLKPLHRVKRVSNRDFIGLYGHIGFRWNILFGWVRPRLNFRALLPQPDVTFTEA